MVVVEIGIRIEDPIGGALKIFRDGTAFSVRVGVGDTLIDDPSGHIADVGRVNDDGVFRAGFFPRGRENYLASSWYTVNP